LNYIHYPLSPGTPANTPVQYRVFYQLDASTNETLYGGAGIVLDASYSANSIILEEYYGVGTANQGMTGYTGATGTIGPTGAAGQSVILQYTKNVNPQSGLPNGNTVISVQPPTYAQNYIASITPIASTSSIYVNFKVQYKCSDVADSQLNLYVYRSINGAGYTQLFGDTYMGTTNAAGPLIGTWTTNYVDNGPFTAGLPVSYQVWYQTLGISSGSGSGTASGRAGVLDSSGNCLVLQELNPTGIAGLGSTGYTGQAGVAGPTGSPGIVLQYTYSVPSTNASLLTNYLVGNGSSVTLPFGPSLCQGYSQSIKPIASSSNIYVNLKVKYLLPDSAAGSATLGLWVTRTSNSAASGAYPGGGTLVFYDASLGGVTGTGLSQLYTTNFVDVGPLNNAITYYYQLWYSVSSTTGSGSYTGVNGIGVLGSPGNCIVLEEMNGSGIAGMGMTGYTGATGATGATGPPGVVLQYQYLSQINSITGGTGLGQGVLTNYLFTGPTGPTGLASYTASITPYSAASNIYINYKVQYLANQQAGNQVGLYVYRKKTTDTSFSYLFGDASLGTYTGGGTEYGTWTTNYIDAPNTNQTVQYQVYAQTNGLAPPGTVGNGVISSTANSLVLEELNGTGVAGAGQYNLAINNTWTGVNTFSNSINQSISPTTISGTFTLPSNPLQVYFVAGTPPYTITFPAPSSSNKGCFVTLRRISGSGTITIAPTIYNIVGPATISLGNYSWTSTTVQFFSDGVNNWIGTFQQ